MEPVVRLHDGRLRSEITGRAPSGMQVKVVLFQDNPVHDDYLVGATPGDGTVQKGRVPGPFLTFEAP